MQFVLTNSRRELERGPPGQYRVRLILALVRV